MAVLKKGILGFAAACLVLSGCASNDPTSPNYDPTFVALGQNFSRPEPLTPAPFVTAGARQAGEFPTFAQMPRGATAQISDVEREIIQAEMAAARAEQRNDRGAAARYRQRVAELQAIARNHGAETRALIEN